MLIAHRGNINGKNPNLENTESYITDAVNSSYKVEIDVWVINKTLYLGHDDPIYKTSFEFLYENSTNLLVHCKNFNALEFFVNHPHSVKFRYFYHTFEECVLSSYGDIILHSHANKFPKNSIYMLPEVLGINEQYLKNCSGICSDVISSYSYLAT
jgi:hypothetical protein